MTKIFIKFFLLQVVSLYLLGINAFPQSKWEWQNPLPHGADMFSAHCMSKERAILAGSGGTIMTTQDHGQNWVIQRLPNVDWVRRYSFISETEGWIIGNWSDAFVHKNFSKIFKTIDGGFSWQELPMNINIDFSIYGFDDIFFLNNKKGYLLSNPIYSDPQKQNSNPGLIYVTEDGGITWTKVNTGISRKYNQIVFLDDLNGFILSQAHYFPDWGFDESQLHRTTDGGESWTTLGGKGYGKLKFISSLNGWAGSYKTTDGGKTWSNQTFNFPELDNSVDVICFADALTGYALSDNTILKTNDGGNSWIKQTELKSGLLQDLQFYDSFTGYTCGYGGTVYTTTDGGIKWNRFGLGITEELNYLDFVDENKGWAVGFYGTVLHTTDSGNSWEKQSLPAECSSVTLRGVCFPDKENGWIAGEDYILHTTNSGNDWRVQLKVDLEKGRFRDIKFLNIKTGFAVGQKGIYLENEEGVLYKTTDGGENWYRLAHGKLPILDEIFIVDSNYIWICGKEILLSTQDGGNSWHSEPFPEFLRYVQFTDHEHGWLSALDEGAFYRTTDGGNTWKDSPYEDRSNEFFNSFYFFSNKRGIASTFLFNNIMTTCDGGLNWSYEERLQPAQLNAITFVNDTTGFAVGTNGAILKYHGQYFNPDSMIQTSSRPANFPNPFNDKTTVEFYLAEPQTVTVTIFDIMGKCIGTFILHDTVAGKNVFKWRPETTSSGIYLIRISCNEFTKVIKSLFIK
ncbi:MAG: YCF48-related protein [Bacteroidota bacterium]|nr:YCF48-related protein [Bacteroidota bacterium]